MCISVANHLHIAQDNSEYKNGKSNSIRRKIEVDPKMLDWQVVEHQQCSATKINPR